MMKRTISMFWRHFMSYVEPICEQVPLRIYIFNGEWKKKWGTKRYSYCESIKLFCQSIYKREEKKWVWKHIHWNQWIYFTNQIGVTIIYRTWISGLKSYSRRLNKVTWWIFIQNESQRRQKTERTKKKLNWILICFSFSLSFVLL